MSDPNAPPTTKEVLLEVARAMVMVLEKRRRFRSSYELSRDVDFAIYVLGVLRHRFDHVPRLEYDEEGRLVVVEEVSRE